MPGAREFAHDGFAAECPEDRTLADARDAGQHRMASLKPGAKRVHVLTRLRIDDQRIVTERFIERGKFGTKAWRGAVRLGEDHERSDLFEFGVR